MSDWSHVRRTPLGLDKALEPTASIYLTVSGTPGALPSQAGLVLVISSVRTVSSQCLELDLAGR